MLDRHKIVALLKINGILPTAPEKEIRAILLGAKYNEDEINAAIIALKEATTSERDNKEGLYKIFRTDRALRPAEITALLGIDVDVSDGQVKRHRERGVSTAHYFIILGLILCLAFGGLLFAMYLNQSGPFHPSVYARK